MNTDELAYYDHYLGLEIIKRFLVEIIIPKLNYRKKNNNNNDINNTDCFLLYHAYINYNRCRQPEFTKIVLHLFVV